ncbi:hypothetical protein [Nitrospirillum iridis]|uniref:Uncharacterized protein n=1 Tax=Nitrospirillum iridis TaxID=765888 RepID=A0A7X0B1M5_9PROT|nr:hypothetical protein [Nitrospirillum iridis]MBB6254104.1 hypothetical protein [Nitrospirillum iridis]
MYEVDPRHNPAAALEAITKACRVGTNYPTATALGKGQGVPVGATGPERLAKGQTASSDSQTSGNDLSEMTRERDDALAKCRELTAALRRATACIRKLEAKR